LHFLMLALHSSHALQVDSIHSRDQHYLSLGSESLWIEKER
jgi:hypothetical protein